MSRRYTLGETQDRIISTLKSEGAPMTINMIAEKMGVTGQTVRNHMPKLERAGEVEIHRRRINGATAFIIGTERSGYIPIGWKDGSDSSVREVFLQLEKQGFDPHLYWGSLQKVIATLYKDSLNALDETNPITPSTMDLRNLRMSLTKIIDDCRFVTQACRDLLDEASLWTPKELPKSLLMEDLDFDMSKARDIIDRLSD
jgi:DNA-binding Lrp family transcriptional regulator